MNKENGLSHPVLIHSDRTVTQWVRQVRTFLPIRRFYPALLFAAIYLASAGYLTSTGGAPLASFAMQAVLLIFLLLTLWMTRGAAPLAVEQEQSQRWRVVAQSAVVLGFILITGYTAVPLVHPVPLWSPIITTFTQLGGQAAGDLGALALHNPVKYFLLPVIILLLLGARFRTLGFEKGNRSLEVIGLWNFLPVVFLGFQVLTGSLDPFVLSQRLVSNLFQNSFFEEFLFRGALQTRLTALINADWALVLQALAFGAWHFGMNLANFHDWRTALAMSLFYHGTLGLAFGIIFRQTRNLLAGSVLHLLFNTLGS